MTDIYSDGRCSQNGNFNCSLTFKIGRIEATGEPWIQRITSFNVLGRDSD